LKKYYGRLSLRRELVYVFSISIGSLGLLGRWLSLDGIGIVVYDACGRLFGGSSVFYRIC